MRKDHIVEATRAIREEQAAAFDFDIDAIVLNAQKRQKGSQHRVVSFAQQKPVSRRDPGKRPKAAAEVVDA